MMRNIGFYVTKTCDKVPVLYDLESVSKLNDDDEDDPNWVNNAMLKLSQQDV